LVPVYPCVRRKSSSVVFGLTSRITTGLPLMTIVKLGTEELPGPDSAAGCARVFFARVDPRRRLMRLVY